MNIAAAAESQSVRTVEGAGLLDQIVAQSKVARSDAEHARAKDVISELVREVMAGTVVVSDNLGVTLDARLADLDRMISDQLSEVMHAVEFQKLESSWTGLHYLCKQTSTGAGMKILRPSTSGAPLGLVQPPSIGSCIGESSGPRAQVFELSTL